ncbi:MAG: hypothetical protein JXQ29_06865 [Planctomycetes bacterium]|nr:hypothetical protein [Planctomycetota bacterium]
MKKTRRSQKLIEPRLQLKFAAVFLTTAAAVVLAQGFGLFFTLDRLAQNLPNDGHIVQMEVASVIQRNCLITLALVAPLSLLVGVLTMFRLVGPLYRFRVYLRQLAGGVDPGPCRIREGDELHDLCKLLNEATEPLREANAQASRRAAARTDATPAAAPPGPAEAAERLEPVGSGASR